MVSQEMSFTDNWSDEEFIRQMKELIGNEGDIHVTCNHSEGEQVTEAHVHAAGVNVSPEGRS
nr:MAG TPA: accessory recombination function protein [Caudoviricetes sp.]